MRIEIGPGGSLNKSAFFLSTSLQFTDSKMSLFAVSDTIDEVKLTQLTDDGVNVFGNTSAV